MNSNQPTPDTPEIEPLPTLHQRLFLIGAALLWFATGSVDNRFAAHLTPHRPSLP